MCKQRSKEYISRAVRQATRHCCLNITQSCELAKTQQRCGRGKKTVISFNSWYVCTPPDAQLVRADAPKTMRQSVVNLPAPGRSAPTPVRQTAAAQKLLFRSFNKPKGLCPEKSWRNVLNLRREKFKLLRSSALTSLPPPLNPPHPPRPREKPLPQSKW